MPSTFYPKRNVRVLFSERQRFALLSCVIATQVAAANVLWDAGEGDPTEKRGAMGCYTIGDRMVNVGSGNYQAYSS